MPIWELAGSNTTSFDLASGLTVTRRFMCNWGERYALANSLIGTQHPELPWAWAKRVTIEPAVSDPVGAPYDLSDPATQIIQYPTTPAIVTVEYGPGLWWPAEIPLPSRRSGTALEITISSSGEFLKVDASTPRWEDNTSGDASGALPPPDSPAARYYVSLTDVQVRWHFVANPPIGRFQDLKGRVNADTFLSAPPETLLLTSWDLAPEIAGNLTSPAAWMVTVHFHHRQIDTGSGVVGWNHELRRDGWKRVYVSTDSGPQLRYQPVVFGGMFV
jgi:hypothetical protein